MIRHFEKWFDSVSDGWNPILVRELRRLAKSRLVPYMTLLHFCLLTMVYIMTFDGRNDPEIPFSTVGLLFPTVFVMFFVEAGFLCRFVFLYHFICWDELLDNTPLRVEEKIEGHLCTSCILSAFFLVQVLPFMLFPLPSPYAILAGLVVMFVIFVIAQTTTLIFLYLFLRFRSTKMTVSKVIIILFVIVVIAFVALFFA